MVIVCCVPQAWAHACVAFLHGACQKGAVSTLSPSVFLHSGNVCKIPEEPVSPVMLELENADSNLLFPCEIRGSQKHGQPGLWELAGFWRVWQSCPCKVRFWCETPLVSEVLSSPG